MGRTHNAQIFLIGVVILPIGWVLGWPIGGHFSKPEYWSDSVFR